MKIYLLLLSGFILFICPDVVLAQANYEGQIIDKTTERPVPFATVTLAKAKIATQTSEQGYFNIKSFATEKDSLIFTCVGYQTYRMPVTAYKKNMFITLQPSSTTLKEVVVGASKKKTKTLGSFNLDVATKYNLSYFYPVPLIAAQMYAKLFEAPKQDGRVIRIDLARGQPGNIWGEMQPGKKTKFKVYIMSVHPKTGAPDSVIFTKEVSLQDRSRKVSIRLESTYIFLNSTKFFVAIEWLRIPYNEYILRRQGIRTVNGNKIDRNFTYDRIVYQPLVARYNRSPKTPSWQMTNGVWHLFEHPEYEIALSATVNY